MNIDTLADRTEDLLKIGPGRLVKLGEALAFTASRAGLLVVRRGLAGAFAEVARAPLTAGQPWNWTPPEAGMYLAEWTGPAGTVKRPFAVVAPDWAVCQITVGAFSAEDFAETAHGAGVAVDYYLKPGKKGRPPAFSFQDPRWVKYEREFGDALYPHVMPNDMGGIDPSLGHEDANWDSLPHEGVVARLAALQKWWVQQGYQPLDRIASYTPCNSLVQACSELGIRILHSVIPEQNWSDGEWAINHWGMPVCPFWIAPDDFRKAGPRPPNGTGVLAMTMNHYHVLLPHLTMWGDFVLSPSHFTRWLRAADSGEASTRFREFLKDTLRGWASLSGDPFFFVAGFEFGRTFGTANMTEYNRRGLEALLEFSRTEQVVFATGNDVRAYYDRHQAGLPESVFRQRDHWMGVTVNGKPGQAGDSIVVERRDYKALVREGEYLPYFYYDYRIPWSFEVRDRNAPHDFSSALRQELQVSRASETELVIRAGAPLSRAIPIGVWDAVPEAGPFPIRRLPLLDDGRSVVLVEIPAGWSGERRLALAPVPVPATRRNDLWKMETFGDPGERHTYLHLDAPLIRQVRARVRLKKRARIDSAAAPLGVREPGVLELDFGPLQGWYRFWDCEVSDIEPEEPVWEPGALLEADWKTPLARHQAELDRAAAAFIGDKETVLYQVHCGALLPLGTRSRAEEFDQVAVPHPTLHAYEKSDGVIAFGPGASFWYHPRGLALRVEGFPAPLSGDWQVLLNTFDPLHLDVRYRVFVGERELPLWEIGADPYSTQAFRKFTITEQDLDGQRRLNLRLASDQKALLHWWREKGYSAALHALWIVRGAA